MKFRDLHARYSVRGYWLFAYVTVLGVLMITTMVCCGILYSRLKSQINERNEIILDTVREYIEEQLIVVNESVARMSTDGEVKNLLTNISLPLDAYDKFEIYEFTRNFSKLNGMENAYALEANVLIYFPNLDMIIGDNKANTRKNFYDVRVDKKSFGYEEWSKLVTEKNSGSYRSLDLYGKGEELFYIKTLPVSYDKTKVVNLIFKINTDKLTTLVKSFYMYEKGLFAVRDSQGNELIKKTFGECGFKDGITIEEIDDGYRAQIFTNKSEGTGWEYIYALPDSVLYKNINIYILLIAFVFVLCILACTVLIKYFIDLNQRAISEVVSMFPNDNDNGDTTTENEYKLLASKISGVFSELSETGHKLDRNESFLKNYLIGSLLSGQQLSDKESGLSFNSLGFNLESGYFVSLVIFINSSPDSVQDNDRAYGYFAIANILDEMLQNLKFTSRHVETVNGLTYIIELPDADEFSNMLRVIELATSIVESEFDFSFHCAVGSVHIERGGIMISCDEAMKVSSQCINENKTGVVIYDEVEARLLTGYSYSLLQENNLIKLIRTNKAAEVISVLDEIFEGARKDNISIDAMRHLIIDLYNTIKKLLIQYGIEADKEFATEKKYLDNIFKRTDTSKMETVIYKIYRECIVKIAGRESQEGISKDIKEYIEKHHKVADLSVQSVAEAFGMNKDYITKKFKESTNMSIASYIKYVRIENSKKLLKKDMAMSDVAEAVGFSNYRTFVRTFTDLEGMTPLKYKNMQKD